MDKTVAEIRQYMRDNIIDHVEAMTGEVIRTSLAEDALWNFIGEPLSQEEEDSVFELAHEVATRYECLSGIRICR